VQTSRPSYGSEGQSDGSLGEPVITVNVPPKQIDDPLTSPSAATEDQAVRDLDDAAGGPRWPSLAGMILSFLGFGVAAYLTYEHYTGSKSLSCPAGSANGAINCLKVTTSVYSVQYGIPVAVLGLVFFAVMLALQSPWAWRSDLRWLKVSRIAWCVIGIASALKLVYDELFEIHAICLWCTSVHILTLAIFVVTLFGTLSWSAHRYAAYELDES
jgi:uncharacterized membrane protein